MAEGVGFEPTVSYPTFDFESSALNRAQPPFHLIFKDLQRAEKSGLDNVTVQCCGLKRNHSMKTPTAPSGVRSPTKVQFLYKHMNGSYYVRTYAGGKEKWTGEMDQSEKRATSKQVGVRPRPSQKEFIG